MFRSTPFFQQTRPSYLIGDAVNDAIFIAIPLASSNHPIIIFFKTHLLLIHDLNLEKNYFQ